MDPEVKSTALKTSKREEEAYLARTLEVVHDNVENYGREVARMQANNPSATGQPRPPERLCAGQTLLCKALGLKVPEWDAQRFDNQRLFVEDVGERPRQIIQTTRLGIPSGRDEHLPYRFVDAAFARHCTRNPIRRGQVQGRDYQLIDTLTTQEPYPWANG